MFGPNSSSHSHSHRKAAHRAWCALAIGVMLSSSIVRAQHPASDAPALAPSTAIIEAPAAPIAGPPPPLSSDRDALRPRRRGLPLIVFGPQLTPVGTRGTPLGIDLGDDDRWFSTDGTARRVFASGLTITLVGAAMVTGGGISLHRWRATQHDRRVTNLQLHWSTLPAPDIAATGLTLGVSANF